MPNSARYLQSEKFFLFSSQESAAEYHHCSHSVGGAEEQRGKLRFAGASCQSEETRPTVATATSGDGRESSCR